GSGSGWAPPPAGGYAPAQRQRPPAPDPRSARAEYALGASSGGSPGPEGRSRPEGARHGYRTRSRWYPFIPTVLVIMLIVAIAELVLPSSHPSVSALAKKGTASHASHSTKPKATPPSSHGHSVDRVAHGKSVKLPAQKKASPASPPSPSPSPSPAALPPVTPVTQTMAVGSLARNYVVYAQPNISGKVPALIVLQGANATNAMEVGRDDLVPFANAGQLVLIYALPVKESWNAGACCESAQAQGINDVGFIDQLVQTIQGQPDVGSVFLAGYSNGGKLAYDVVCSNPTLVKGLAVVAATPTVACPNGAPVSLVTMDGTKDPVQAYNSSSSQHTNGTFKEASTVDEVNTWVARDGCKTHAQQTMGKMVLDSWSNCNGGTAVQLGSIVGGGHEWYGGVGATPSDTDLIWAFMTQTVPTAGGAAPTATSSPAS
ncbi:MAG: alpha/beta hydrolase family esterase, partial [Actinomycetota bacterium]